MNAPGLPAVCSRAGRRFYDGSQAAAARPSLRRRSQAADARLGV